jgi:hypothetical protein
VRDEGSRGVARADVGIERRRAGGGTSKRGDGAATMGAVPDRSGDNGRGWIGATAIGRFNGRGARGGGSRGTWAQGGVGSVYLEARGYSQLVGLDPLGPGDDLRLLVKEINWQKHIVVCGNTIFWNH